MAKQIPPIVSVFRAYFNSIGLVFKKHSAKQLIKLFSTPRKKVVRQQEIEILKKAKKSKMQLGGETMVLYEWGEGDRLAMLFHGWESNAGSLGAFVQLLLDEGYRILSFDAPAHGKSDGKYANLVYFKAAAKTMMTTYGVPDLVVGHSLGGNSIIMTAFEEGYKFEKVILVSPLNRLMSVFEEMKSILRLPEELFNMFINRFEKEVGYDFRTFYFHEYLEKGPLNNVLLFHDLNDRVTSFSHAKTFQQESKKVSLTAIEGSGHYKILWNEEVLEKSKAYIA